MDIGSDIEQNKTGITPIKEGAPRLRATMQLVRNVFEESRDFVIKGATGNKASLRPVNEWWNKVKNQRDPDTGLRSDAPSTISKQRPFISDDKSSSRDKPFFSGHMTESQGLTYDRKVKITPSLDAPLPAKKAQDGDTFFT